ncbi:hypothetical protein KM043_000814 [Ampulex compressa]|nr:hypothetical protein KM043_000814 [Ampulex compressa]
MVHFSPTMPDHCSSPGERPNDRLFPPCRVAATAARETEAVDSSSRGGRYIYAGTSIKLGSTYSGNDRLEYASPMRPSLGRLTRIERKVLWILGSHLRKSPLSSRISGSGDSTLGTTVLEPAIAT